MSVVNLFGDVRKMRPAAADGIYEDALDAALETYFNKYSPDLGSEDDFTASERFALRHAILTYLAASPAT